MMKMRKLRWYNKLAISFRERFVENINYSVDIMNRSTLSRFVFKYKVQLLIIFSPIVLLAVVFVILAMFNNVCEKCPNLFEVNLFDAFL